MDPATVFLLIGLMVLLGVLLVNAVVAGTVMRLERFRMVREREREQHEYNERKLRIERGEILPALPPASAEPPALPRAVNAYIAALLVTGVPTMSFFAALFGGVSGWAWIAAGGASVAAVVGAITLCALPEKNEGDTSPVAASQPSQTNDGSDSSHESSGSDAPTITPGFAPTESNAAPDSGGTSGSEHEQRSPEDMNG